MDEDQENLLGSSEAPHQAAVWRTMHTDQFK